MSLSVLCREGCEDLRHKLRSLEAVSSAGNNADQKQLSELRGKIDVMQSVVDALETANNSIELSNSLEPIKILGWECNASTVVTICTSFFTFVGYVIAAMKSNGSNNSSSNSNF